MIRVPIEYGVIHVDKSGYRVAGSLDVLDDKTAATGILEIARGAVALAKALRRPVATITVNWPGGSGVVKVRNGEVVAVLLEESKSSIPSTPHHGSATATG